MMSRLVKAWRRTFGRPAAPLPPPAAPLPPPAAPLPPPAERARHEGNFVFVNHDFYGDLQLLANDKGISAWLFDGQTIWEADIVDLFARHFQPGRNVVDAGANLGLHSIALAKLARSGEQVYAFEPHPEIFPLAKFNCNSFPNVHCINKAASDRASRFYMSSVMTWENAGGVGLSADKQQGQYEVESVSIDSLGLENIGFMKIDVEGHELSCIEGASETIRRDRPTLIVEIMGGNSLETASPEIAAQITERINAICAYGYRASTVSPHDYLFEPSS